MASRPKGAPEPTPLQLDFIRASEEEAQARLSEQRKQLEAMSAAQAEREMALHKAEEAQHKRAAMARIRNIALVVVTILAVLAGWLGWSAEQARITAEEQRALAEQQRVTAEEQRTLAEQQKKTAEEQRQQADDILASAENIILNLGDQMDIKTQREAVALLAAGAIHGDAIAMHDLGVSYRKGFGVPQDYAKAREWFEKAAARDNADAMENLGFLYENGQGVPQDYAKASEWFEKAAAKDNAEAMSMLGVHYANGYVVPQDYGKAREFFEKAAAKDNADAMVHLGFLYEVGQGVPQDYAKAREWFERGAAKDSARAKMALEQLPIREAATAGRYDEALRLEEAFAAKVEAEETKREGKLGEQTAGELQGVTWYALFAKDYTKALAVADHAHALFPDNLGIETNRTHALMFTGHDEEAKALYLAHKGEPLSQADKKLWEQAIAEDFAKFRKAGLTSPMMADIEKELGISR